MRGSRFVLRHGFEDDGDEVSLRTGLSCPEEESVVQQQFKDESDINEIVRRFGLTGELPLSERVPLSGDFTGITDFHSAMNAVVAAQEGFDDLPATIRARFSNDPGLLLEFLADDKNRDEAVKLGIVAPAPEKTRDVVTAVDELAAKMVKVSKAGKEGLDNV